ncbi:hypothetical protein GCM10010341_12810 [Streptomyces noursei]|nr:hypothetical protein GCM10010341_12810 [Streptomyces noursei]
MPSARDPLRWSVHGIPFLPLSWGPGIPAGVGVAPWQGRTAVAGREAPPTVGDGAWWAHHSVRPIRRLAVFGGTCHYPVRVKAGARGARRRTVSVPYAADVPRRLTTCIRAA